MNDPPMPCSDAVPCVVDLITLLQERAYYGLIERAEGTEGK